MDHHSTTKTRLIRVLAIITLAATTGYLVWRATDTITDQAAWVAIPFFALEAAGLISLALFVYSVWNTDSTSPARPAQSSDHRLAVLIPTYNEGLESLLPTVAAARAVSLDHETWILDDGKRAWVAEMAADLGVNYLTRPDNSHAKAGNLNHALEVIDADLVAILDADHVPRPNLLSDTVGYFDDPDLALVQTPQAFYNDDSFEHVGDDYQEEAMFYRVIQPGKNLHDAAFWCGTSAVVRSDALRSVGGVAVDTLTEDLHTTLRLHRKGWRTVFHNQVLAQGLAPMSYEEYAIQRKRWAGGAMQILRSDNPIFGRGLTLRQRLAYAATFSGWFESLRTLGYLLVAMAVVVTGVSPVDAPLMVFAPIYGAVFIAQQATQLLMARGRHKTLPGMLFDWYRLSAGLQAVRQLVWPGEVSFRVTPKGRTGDEREPATYPRTLSGLLAASVGCWAWFVATALGFTPLAYPDLLTVGVALVFLIINAVLISFAVSRAVSPQFSKERRAGRRLVELERPVALGGRSANMTSVSLTGATVALEAGHIRTGDSTSLWLEAADADGADGLLELRCRVRRYDRGVAAVEFDPGQWSALAEISQALFGHTSRWDLQGDGSGRSTVGVGVEGLAPPLVGSGSPVGVEMDAIDGAGVDTLQTA